MSVQINQYLVYGVQLDPKSHPVDPIEREGDEKWVFDDVYDSAFKHEFAKHIDGITVIYDSMNGHYYLAGKVLAKAIDGEFLGDGEPLLLPKLSTKVKRQVAAGLLKHFGITDKPEFIFLTHYR